MLRIDRVDTEMEILPDQGKDGARSAATPASAPAITDQFRAMVMEVLQDHLRQLERRGTL